MDIRTKLVFALVAVSLGSMLALGAFAYDAARELLADVSLRQLDALAESKKDDLGKVIVAWRDRVQLVVGRSDLQGQLRALPRTPESARRRIERILDDALASVEALKGISVYTPDGVLVTSRGFAPAGEDSVRPATFLWADQPVVYDQVTRDSEGMLVVSLIAPIRRGGVLIGAAKVRLAAHDLMAITGDYTGLGETGETLVARNTGTGDALVLNPLRHDPGAAEARRIGAENEDAPALRAALGHEGVLRDGAVDYRGRTVWAATRYLPDFEWGVVVKVDREEEFRAAAELRDTMWKLAVSLSAFAIVAGTLLGLYIARPIRELAEVAERIGEGELDLRARVESEDEVGLLARTFNEMTEELIATNRKLEKRVRQREDGGDS